MSHFHGEDSHGLPMHGSLHQWSCGSCLGSPSLALSCGHLPCFQLTCLAVHLLLKWSEFLATPPHILLCVPHKYRALRCHWRGEWKEQMFQQMQNISLVPQGLSSWREISIRNGILHPRTAYPHRDTSISHNSLQLRGTGALLGALLSFLHNHCLVSWRTRRWGGCLLTEKLMAPHLLAMHRFEFHKSLESIMNSFHAFSIGRPHAGDTLKGHSNPVEKPW